MSEEYNSCKGLTPQQALNELCDDLSICNDAECENQKDLEFSRLWVRQHKELIEKSLKALEIITQRHFTFDDSKHEVWLGDEWITDIKEEYELLTEILKD